MSTKRVLCGGALVFLVLLLLEIIFVQVNAFYWWQGIWGVDFFRGLLGTLVLFGLAKGLIGKLVTRPENYYATKEGGEHHV